MVYTFKSPPSSTLSNIDNHSIIVFNEKQLPLSNDCHLICGNAIEYSFFFNHHINPSTRLACNALITFRTNHSCISLDIHAYAKFSSWLTTHINETIEELNGHYYTQQKTNNVNIENKSNIKETREKEMLNNINKRQRKDKRRRAKANFDITLKNYFNSFSPITATNDGAETIHAILSKNRSILTLKNFNQTQHIRLTSLEINRLIHASDYLSFLSHRAHMIAPLVLEATHKWLQLDDYSNTPISLLEWLYKAPPLFSSSTSFFDLTNLFYEFSYLKYALK